MDGRVFAAMEPILKNDYGNPSSFHGKGKEVSDALQEARDSIADILGVRSDEIIFTSGGTESDNLAILGFARKNKDKGMHIISCKTEHEAVLESLEQLEKEGFEVTLLDPDREGRVSAEQVEKALREDTILVTLMYANNEIGTIHPIAEIGNAIEKVKKESNNNLPIFHTDACQAPGSLSLNVASLHVDMMTLNGSKMYGPKGVGLLYVRRGLKLQPLVFGGSQERSVRPGTENAAGIIGMAEALKID